MRQRRCCIILAGKLRWFFPPVAYFVRARRARRTERLDDALGGYGVDGPEARRVRRALRDGTPLRPSERRRALADTRARLERATSTRVAKAEGRSMIGWIAYGLGVGLVLDGAPDRWLSASVSVWMVVLLAVVAALWWWGTSPRAPGRERRARRLRERLEALEEHPVAA